MAVKKISELPTAGVGDITPDDVLILNDGSTTKKTLLADLLQGTEEFDANFNNLVVNGDLTVQGTTTTVNTEQVTLADNEIILNSDYAGSTPSENAGITVNRDQAGDKSLLWNEGIDKWSVGTETFVAETLEGNLVGSVFSDSSVLLVDGLNSKVTGPVDTESVTNSEGNLSVTADNYVTIDSNNNGQIEIGRFSGIGNVIIGNDSNQTDVSIDGNVIIKSSTTFDFNGATITGTDFARSGTGDTVSFNSVTASLTGDVISVSNGAKIIDSVANTVLLQNNSTDDLPEGSTNRYYSDDQVDSHLTGGTGVTYNQGEISIGQSVATSADVTFNNITATTVTADVIGSVFANNNTEMVDAAAAKLNIGNNTTDELVEGSTNLYYSNSLVDAYLSEGTGVSISNGEISIGQAVGSDADVTFNDVQVNGNFTVQGTTTTVNTEEINLADNIIRLNSDYSGSSPNQNAGIEINRGTESAKTLVWNETDDKWSVGTETFVAASFEGNLVGNVDGTVNDISNFTSDDLPQGTSNLYFTNPQARAAFSAGGDIQYDQGNGVFSFSQRTDQEIRLLVSAIGDLSYDFTTGVFSYSIANNSTDDLPEGSSNRYYADSLVDFHLSGGTGVTYSSGEIAIGQSVSTSDSVSFSTVTAEFTGDITGDVISESDGTVLVNSTANTVFLSNNSSDDLPEGSSNLYYKNSLVDAYLSGGTGITYSSGEIAIGQSVGISDSVEFASITTGTIVSTQFIGDVTGSVFADDSAVLVDAVNGVIPGYVAIDEIKTIVANSIDFSDFQTRIANNL
jgi:hypothetical protein